MIDTDEDSFHNGMIKYYDGHHRTGTMLEEIIRRIIDSHVPDRPTVVNFIVNNLCKGNDETLKLLEHILSEHGYINEGVYTPNKLRYATIRDARSMSEFIVMSTNGQAQEIHTSDDSVQENYNQLIYNINGGSNDRIEFGYIKQTNGYNTVRVV